MSFIKITEQNSLYNDLERKSVRDLLEDINTEDQKVALAVRETIPKIEELVLQIVPRMKQGGRIFYLELEPAGGWEFWMLPKSPRRSGCLPH